MKFNIFCKNNKETEKIKDLFYNFFISHNFEFNETSPDICFIIGGDGTVLRAIHKHINHLDKVKFVTIHDGTLGYFADFQKSEMEAILSTINNKQYYLTNSPLIKLHIISQLGKEKDIYALNEITVQNNRQTMIADVMIDNEHLEKFRGSGFCISTPTGSTAYNKSLGGAIIFRDLEVFQITEIASINHNRYHSLNAPIILGNNHIFTLFPILKDNLLITADHDAWLDKNELLKDENDSYKQFDFTITNKFATFIVPTNSSYISRLKRCFII